MKPIILALSIMAVSSQVWAEDFILPDGTIYKDAKVTSKGADFISVSHSDGVAKVKFSKLSPDQQKAYDMTPDVVEDRLLKKNQDDKKKKEYDLAQQKLKLEANKQLRDALEASQKQPRYLTGQEIQKMFVAMGDISAVEAEVMALNWNTTEALKAGLSHEAEMFKSQIARYDDAMKKVREERESAAKYWEKLSKDYEDLQKKTNQQIAKLKSDVNTLSSEVKKNEEKEKRVIISGPIISGPWNYPSPVYVPVPRPCPRPHPVNPPNRPSNVIPERGAKIVN